MDIQITESEVSSGKEEIIDDVESIHDVKIMKRPNTIKNQRGTLMAKKQMLTNNQKVSIPKTLHATR